MITEKSNDLETSNIKNFVDNFDVQTGSVQKLLDISIKSLKMLESLRTDNNNLTRNSEILVKTIMDNDIAFQKIKGENLLLLDKCYEFLERGHGSEDKTDDYASQIERMSADYCTLEKSYVDLRLQYDKKLEYTKIVEDESESLLEKCEDLESENVSLFEENVSLQKTIKKLEDNMKNYLSEIDNLKGAYLQLSLKYKEGDETPEIRSPVNGGDLTSKNDMSDELDSLRRLVRSLEEDKIKYREYVEKFENTKMVEMAEINEKNHREQVEKLMMQNESLLLEHIMFQEENHDLQEKLSTIKQKYEDAIRRLKPVDEEEIARQNEEKIRIAYGDRLQKLEQQKRDFCTEIEDLEDDKNRFRELYEKANEDIMFLENEKEMLLEEKNALRQDYIMMETDRDRIAELYKILKEDYTTLENDKDRIMGLYEQLKEDHYLTEIDKHRIVQTYENLAEDFYLLEGNKNRITDLYEELKKSYLDLENERNETVKDYEAYREEMFQLLGKEIEKLYPEENPEPNSLCRACQELQMDLDDRDQKMEEIENEYQDEKMNYEYTEIELHQVIQQLQENFEKVHREVTEINKEIKKYQDIIDNYKTQNNLLSEEKNILALNVIESMYQSQREYDIYEKKIRNLNMKIKKKGKIIRKLRSKIKNNLILTQSNSYCFPF